MNRSCVGYRRSRPRHHDTVRLGRDGHRQQLVLRLLANTEGSLAILVSPLEHLVRIYSMLTSYSGNRSSRDKRGFYDPTLLLRRPAPAPLNRCDHLDRPVRHRTIPSNSPMTSSPLSSPQGGPHRMLTLRLPVRIWKRGPCSAHAMSRKQLAATMAVDRRSGRVAG